MSLVHKILFPTDFSVGATSALEYAIELGRAFSASLLIVHIYAPPAILTPEGVVMPIVDEVALRADLEAGLAKAAARARERGLAEVGVALYNGSPWQEIIKSAKERDCDLIVMATHGRGAVAHLVLGSVAEKVVRKAECPVLTVGPRTPPATP